MISVFFAVKKTRLLRSASNIFGHLKLIWPNNMTWFELLHLHYIKLNLESSVMYDQDVLQEDFYFMRLLRKVFLRYTYSKPSLLSADNIACSWSQLHADVIYWGRSLCSWSSKGSSHISISLHRKKNRQNILLVYILIMILIDCTVVKIIINY